MSKFDSIYVPDDLWQAFERGEVHHFDYGEPISAAVFADGRRVEFDSTVTEEMRDNERAKRRQATIDAGGFVHEAKFSVKIDPKNFRGFIYNAGV